MAGIAAAFLLLRAFSSGCAALTGVEAISNGVPAFQKPKSRNAATTLLLMGAAVDHHARHDHRAGPGDGHQDRRASRPSSCALNGQPVGEATSQHTVLGQLAHAVFGGFTLGIIYVSIMTGLILILAANTAFNGFPVLGSILAKDGYLPRQLHTRGDRLAFSNGILILAAAARAPDRRLPGHGHLAIQLYIVGVFVSFTLSQSGMIRHWNRHLEVETDPKVRARMKRSRVINAVGAAMSGIVLLVVLITKFQAGARYAILAMAVLFVLMLGIQPPLPAGARRAGARRGRDADAAQPGARDRPHLQAAQAHDAGARLRPGDPADLPRGDHRRRRPRGHRDAAATSGRGARSRSRSRCWPRPTARSPGRSSTTCAPSARGNPRDVVIVYIPEYVLGRW